MTNDETIRCKVFVGTLQGKAATWFNTKPEGLIKSCVDLQKVFLGEFSTVGILPKTKGELSNIKQKSSKSILDYVKRFREVLEQISMISNDEVLTCFEGGLMTNSLKTNLYARSVKNRAELFDRAQRIGSAESPMSEESKKKHKKKKNGGQ